MHCCGRVSLQPVMRRSFIEPENGATFPPRIVSQITGPLRNPSSRVSARSILGARILVEVGESRKTLKGCVCTRIWGAKEEDQVRFQGWIKASVKQTAKERGGTRRYLNYHLVQSMKKVVKIPAKKGRVEKSWRFHAPTRCDLMIIDILTAQSTSSEQLESDNERSERVDISEEGCSSFFVLVMTAPLATSAALRTTKNVFQLGR